LLWSSPLSTSMASHRHPIEAEDSGFLPQYQWISCIISLTLSQFVSHFACWLTVSKDDAYCLHAHLRVHHPPKLAQLYQPHVAQLVATLTITRALYFRPKTRISATFRNMFLKVIKGWRWKIVLRRPQSHCSPNWPLVLTGFIIQDAIRAGVAIALPRTFQLFYHPLASIKPDAKEWETLTRFERQWSQAIAVLLRLTEPIPDFDLETLSIRGEDVVPLGGNESVEICCLNGRDRRPKVKTNVQLCWWSKLVPFDFM
jgi:hypothetical protein